jgi:alkylation response protein AidB-like acyl-CoA dehydrogenase
MMSLEFTWTDEQNELRRTVRAFCAAESPESEIRRVMETPEGFDRRVWRRLAAELGLTGLAVPAEYGGAGHGPVELGVVFEELGRALACVPYFATAGLAVPALLASGDRDADKEYLPAIAAGEMIATLAVPEESGSWDPGDVTLEATASGSGPYNLTGVKEFVPDGVAADLILVAARTAAGISLFAVPGGAPGLDREPLPVMDQTRPQAKLTFRAAQARLVGEDGAGRPVLHRALDEAAAALAAEQAGGAQRVLDMAVGYAKTRYQFGRPIGSFQAIKHRCADLLADVESARSVAYHAGWAAAAPVVPGDPGELPLAAALAKSYCSEVFVRAATECVQIHGGIGFTWEHPAHLYLKRALTDRAMLGDPGRHRRLLADLAGL